jgi:hypothetical protein
MTGAEGPGRRGAMPRAAVGVAYAEGQAWLRRGQPAVGVYVDSCSASMVCARWLNPVPASTAHNYRLSPFNNNSIRGEGN